MTTPPVNVALRACAKTWPDGTRALHPVDLDIPGGEILALLGPSGCGKTTLLRMICGLETPDRGGTILLDGEDVAAQPPERRGIGVVFQNYALFPNMSVLENAAYGLRVRGWPAAKRDARAREMLERVRLQDFADRRITQLSGGQRQRVALARALAIEPRVLLLDEPLTALDAKLREHLRVELAQMLRALRITTVIVTHDQDEAMMLGDRIAVMSAGRLEQLGTAESLYRQPATPFVASFLGTLCTVRGALHDDVLIAGDAALHFRPHEASLMPTTGLQATIVDRFFLGNTIRYEVRLDDGQAFPVIAPPDSPYVAGARIGVRLTPVTPPVTPAPASPTPSSLPC
ncbi:ABC transporter ATP-binding protein [Schauerella aestuarii]|uniref:ABC transporter ATP-binding protein n=1 Tax=Schauerella aestuarii TaxID=2511204 RepID=UPI001371BA50|nr:ABC transporter ATP-binding protein [Achromobacter aestuarii]MYZ44563.1 ABC transporter ATP-binding protein [Achromobacter aestuarii]